MKRKINFAAVAIAASTFLLTSGAQSQQHYGSASHAGGAPHTPRPHVVIKMRHVAVPQPERIAHPEHIVRDNRQINYPRNNESGVRITQPAARIPPTEYHGQIMHNQVLVQNISQREHVETVRNHYYWHVDGKVRYAHYYDGFGVHWYGFYHGQSFYWTRYWGNRWWWYDPHFLRWVYWGNGYWWWPSPAGTVYVYTNDNYYPYESGGTVTVANPEIQTPPAAGPASPTVGHVSTSQDMSRMVQIDPEGNAYLYDYSTGQQVYMKFLGQGVDKVKLSGGKDGKPVQILVEFKDGSFAMYDNQGNPLDAPNVSSDETPGAPPESTPPPPDASAAGQPGAPQAPAATSQPPAAAPSALGQ